MPHSSKNDGIKTVLRGVLARRGSHNRDSELVCQEGNMGLRRGHRALLGWRRH